MQRIDKPDALKKQLNKKLDRMNQSVTITDIVVRQKGKGRGEFDHKSSYKKPARLARMKDHINLLASIADMHHKKRHFVQDEQQKLAVIPGHENDITRLMSHELSFYTKDKPLSEKEFRSLVRTIESIAKEKTENLYLVLSSIPVKNDNEEVFNYVVHVQCGQHPKIDVAAKVSPTLLDPVYPDTTNVSYSKTERNHMGKAASILLPYRGCEHLPAINYGTIVACETIGGAKFNAPMDICMDHFRGEAKKSFVQYIETTTRDESVELVPNQFSHFVTANSICFFKTNILGDKVVKADPKEEYALSDAIKLDLLSQDYLHKSDLLLGYKNKYKKLDISVENGLLQIMHPPFGPDISMSFYSAHTLDVLAGELKEKVETHNAAVINHYRSKQSANQNNPLSYSEEIQAKRRRLC